MKVISLFDGMSCGQIALERLGFKPQYFASEIDKYAIQVTQKNYPNTFQIGDVRNIHGGLFGQVDLVIAGSPCQGFSNAGKGLNFEDPRSALFFEFVRILEQCKPKYFLLENVRMKKEWQDVISGYLGVEPIRINSNLLSAQNRDRFYWTNIPFAGDLTDRGILLRDVIEGGFVDKNKSFCIDANYFKGGNLKQYFNKSRRQLVFVFQKGRGKNPTGFRALDGKTPSLTSSRWEQNNFAAMEGLGGKIFYRKLTPVECERLQTVDDNYTQNVSNSQRYKMLGNGMTVDVIVELLRGMSL